MEREGDLGNYLRFNFENAIEIIDKLTKDNNDLIDKVEKLETKLNKPTIIPREPIRSRFNCHFITCYFFIHFLVLSFIIFSNLVRLPCSLLAHLLQILCSS